MRTVRPEIFFLLSLIVLLPSGVFAVNDPFPDAARSYVLYINGNLIWAHEPELTMPPASLTKIMTSIIVLEKVRLDEIVTVNRTAEQETGTTIKLKAGERYYVIDLLAATLIQSANDACRALAEHVSGSEKDFVKVMNKRAAEFGLKNTRFKNACGHDMPGHYSTAEDMAKLAFTALKYKTFAKMVSIVNGTISTADEKREIHLENKNELIGRYYGATGIKSGTTLKAGKCLAALAERDGTEVLLVILNSPDRWWKAVSMLDRAFAHATKTGIK